MMIIRKLKLLKEQSSIVNLQHGKTIIFYSMLGWCQFESFPASSDTSEECQSSSA